jgi:hypothetical protein
VPRVRVPGPGVCAGEHEGPDLRRGARAHGRARRGLPRRRVQPRVPQLQPLLRRLVQARLGQPTRQGRGRLHLGHPGDRTRTSQNSRGNCQKRRLAH